MFPTVLNIFFSFGSLKLCTFYQGLPRLRFNKEGNLLAVTTVDNGFKILANADGLRTLRAFGNRPFEAFRSQYEASSMKVPAHSLLLVIVVGLVLENP